MPPGAILGTLTRSSWAHRAATRWRLRLDGERGGGLFLLQPPGAVPARVRRIGLELHNAGEQRARGAVAGDGFERRVEGRARIVETAGAIGGKAFGIVRAQTLLR